MRMGLTWVWSAGHYAEIGCVGATVVSENRYQVSGIQPNTLIYAHDERATKAKLASPHTMM